MKIGIDARPLQGETRFRGIGKALENVLQELAKLHDVNVEFIFYLDKKLDQPAVISKFPDSVIKYVASSIVRKQKYIRVITPAFKPIRPARGDVDVLLQYDAALGVPTTVPTLVMFHDLIPVLFHDHELKSEHISNPLKKAKRGAGRSIAWKRYQKTLLSYRKATHLAALSESSRKDLLAHDSKIIADKISVLYLGVNQVSVQPKALANKSLSAPYLLYVGGIDVRKNIKGLLKEFFKLKQDYRDLKLVLVGKEFGLHDQLEAIGWYRLVRQHAEFEEDIIYPGFISEQELAWLYQHAAAFVFPSRYEGFGLPVLEAMQAGCPVVAYDNSSIPEVAGDAALLVEDGEPMAPSIKQLLDDNQLRENLKAKGYQQAKKFSWQQTAASTLALLKKVAEHDQKR